MKRSTKQLLSMLLAIVMVFGLMAPALAARPMGGDVAETPVGEAAPVADRPSFSGKKATLLADADYTFTAATDLASLAANDKVCGQYGNNFFKMGGTLTKKNDTAMEVGKDKAGWVEFTVTGSTATFTATIEASSSNAQNASTVELWKYDATQTDPYTQKVTSSPEVVAPTSESTDKRMDGTWANLTEGTYRLVCTTTKTTARVVTCSVTETDGTAPSACEHTTKTEVAGSARPKACLTAGKEADQMCAACYKVFPGADIAAWGSHDFQDGVCTRCKEADPSVQKPGGTYVLDIKTDNPTPGTKGTTVKSGTKNYFTIGWNGDGNSTVDTFPGEGNYEWSDGYTSNKRLKLDKMDRTTPAGEAFVGFKPLADVDVEVWWAGGGAENKPLILTSGTADNATPAVGTNGVVWFKGAADKTTPQYDKITIPYDETATNGYKFLVKGGQISVYKIVITEKLPDTAYTVDIKTDNPTPGTKGTTSKAGTGNYFTFGWNGDGNNTVDTFPGEGNYEWSDGYTSNKRLKLDKMDRTTPAGEAFLGFKPSRNAIVEVWWAGGGAENKPLILTSGTADNATPAVGTNGVVWFKGAADKTTPQYDKITIPYDETATNGYKFLVKGGQISVYKVVVTETDTLEKSLADLIKEISAADMGLTAANADTEANAVKTLETKIKNIVNSDAITVTLTPTANSFSAAVDGTFTAQSGTDGEIKFTVKLTKGTDEATTAELTAPITAQAFKAVTGVTITAAGSATSVEKGKALQLTATVTPADATVKDVEWSVAAGSEQYARMLEGGKVYGTNVTPDGTKVTVTAKATDGSEVTGTIELTVTPAALDPSAVYINDGAKHSFAASDIDYTADGAKEADWQNLGADNYKIFENEGFEAYETTPGNIGDDKGMIGMDPRNNALRIPKNMGAGILFKVGPEGGRVNLQVKANSTGGTSYSPVFLVKDPEGLATEVREDEGNKFAYGTKTATVLNWTGLDEGTYLICSKNNSTMTSPEGTAVNRGFRLMAVRVSPTGPDDKIPTPVLQTYETCAGTAKVNFNLPAAVEGKITVNAATMKVDIEDLLMGTLDKADAADSPLDEFYQFAEGVKVAFFDAQDKETDVKASSMADNVKLDAEGNFVADKLSLTLKPDTSGTYTIKAIVTHDGADEVLATSESFKYDLPLGTPRTSATVSEAGRMVTLKWNAISEATHYEVRYAPRGESVPAADSADMVVERTAATPAADSHFTKDENGNYVWSATMDEKHEGQVLTFYVVAIREGAVGANAQTVSVANSLKVQNAAQRQWDTKVFGTSASNNFNWKEGDLNADGQVKLYSTNGSGKITEMGSDGMLFYYTAMPKGTNYSIKAKVHVDRWQQQDTQNGVGIAALDRVAEKDQTGATSSNAGNFWNNSYMAGAARLGFKWDKSTATAYANDDPGADAYTSYSYYMGLLSIVKSGVNKGYEASAQPKHFFERRFPLDTRLPSDDKTCKFGGYTNRFNTIGNWTAPPKGLYPGAPNVESAFMEDYELTDFYVQLEKTNYGYVTTIWDEKGTLLGTNTEWFAKGAAELSDGDGDSNPYTHLKDAVDAEGEPTASTDQSGNVSFGAEVGHMDSEYEYIGFFTSRDMDAVFSEVEIKEIAQADDTRMLMPPNTPLKPNVKITSGTSSNDPEYTLSVVSNVDGWVTITKDGAAYTDADGVSKFPVKADERLDLPMTLNAGNNRFVVKLAVDTEMEMPPFVVLDLSEEIKDAVASVSYDTGFGSLQNIFVSPDANSTGRGTRRSPVDVYTAVAAVKPGQNIILLGGEYKLTKTIRISQGMNGTAEKPIYFVADPNATETVVLNGQRSVGAVIIHGGNHWVFKDFEVVGSSDGNNGFQVSGSYNLVQNVKCHDNGSTGLQISRLSNSVLVPDRGINPDTGEPYGPATPPVEGVTPVNWGEWPCYNTILNCDSYRNYDSGYGGADGFAAKLTVGEGNVFDGCAAYWNADDGWDLYAKTSDEEGCIGKVVLKNCVAFENGYEVRALQGNPSDQNPYMEGYNAKMDYKEDGSINLKPAGNGNGFKLGGSHLPGAHEIYNSYAFYNAAKGFDSNNGPDIHVVGCTSYNNGEENVGLGSNHTPLQYVVSKVVSFKDEKAPLAKDGETVRKADEIKEGKGNSIDEETYYAWNGTKSTNGSSTLKATSFKSLDFDAKAWVDGAHRKDSGALDLGQFLMLKSDLGAGAQDLVNDTTPVANPDNVVNPPEEGSNDKPTSGGNGGTIGGNGKPDDDKKPDDEKPAAPTYTPTKTTNTAGDTTIVVKDDKTGETVAEVKIPGTIPASDVKFDDAIGHWAEESIDDMAALGVVNGIGDNLFGVDSDITRGALATMLFRFANGKEGIANTFADVADGQWYTDAIGWAVKTGVVTGYSADAFGPNDTITREQLAVMLWRFAKLVGLNGTTSSGDLDAFQDASSVGSWATEGMAWCVRNGIIKGVSADTLSPTTSATRAQTATMLSRFIELMK